MLRSVCPECGDRSPRHTEFCSQCGSYLDWAEAPSAGTDDVEPAAPDGAGADGPPGDPPATREVVAVPTPRRPVDDAVPACPRCGADRGPGLRFCRSCALEFDPPGVARAWGPRPPRRAPWWRRLVGGGRPPAERAALRAYRRSLPLRHRLFRLAVTLLALALAAGAVVALRGDPVGWVQSRFDDLRDTLEPATVQQAALDPASAPERPEYAPRFATDRDEGSAWATAWTAGDGPVACGAGHGAEGLVLALGEVVDLRAVEVLAGLPAGDPLRQGQVRPRTVELRFSDGSCALIALRDAGEPQRVRLPQPVSTSSVRVDVVEVYPAAQPQSDLVAISELELLRRPAR
jgi:ribosomal protein L40E